LERGKVPERALCRKSQNNALASSRDSAETVWHPSTPSHPTEGKATMKKLALDLDSLRVESFETLSAPRGGGTVQALEVSETYLFPECYVDPSIEQGGTCPNQTCISPPPTQGSTPECCL
jgi:hypothetical protein